MKRYWKLLLSALLLLSLLVFTACSGDNDNNGGDDNQYEETNGQGGDVTDVPERNLGGRVMRMANWWTESCTETINWGDLNFADYERWRDRQAMEDRYNFRMIVYRYGGYHDVRENHVGHMLAEEDRYISWALTPAWFFSAQAQNLLAGLDPSYFDPSHGIGFSRGVMDMTTVGGRVHGWSTAQGEVGGVYFNMRLLEEAGFDRHHPFNLQAAGNWNWTTFNDMLQTLAFQGLDQVTGLRETFALTTFHQYMLNMALASNGAAFAIPCPDTGRLINATNTDAFRETIEWMVQLRTEMIAMHEMDVDGEWDAFVTMFNDGRGGVRIAGSYVAGNLTLTDDWGFVAFPTGPQSTPGTHPAWLTQNPWVVPWFFSEDEIDDLMFALRAWYRPLDAAEDDDWKFGEFARHPDPRSVEETMALHTRNPANFVSPAHVVLPAGLISLSDHFHFRVWTGEHTAAYIIESAQLVLDAALESFNAAMER